MDSSPNGTDSPRKKPSRLRIPKTPSSKPWRIGNSDHANSTPQISTPSTGTPGTPQPYAFPSPRSDLGNYSDVSPMGDLNNNVATAAAAAAGSPNAAVYRTVVEMSGWVHKCQSRMPSSVKRFFRLSDSMLYNHAQINSKPTWSLSVSKATVRADYARFIIMLNCPKRHLRFHLPTGAETHRWLIALRTAAMCNVNDFYTMGKTIGTGSFGTVREAVDKSTGAKRAIKIVHRTSNHKEREFISREMSVLLTIGHPNVVRTYDIFDERHRILVVMHFVSGGDLFDYVVHRGSLSEATTKHAIWQIITGIHYLHEHNIVHRDIKLENILVAQKSPLRLQLTDFGFANYVDPSSDAPARDLNSLVGTGSYMAPEVIDGSGHGTPVDVFAAGVVMFRLLAGHMPFRAISLRESYELALAERADFGSKNWEKVSSTARMLCRAMLAADPSRRPSAQEVLDHQWFTKDEEFLAEASVVEEDARLKDEKETLREQELYDRACGALDTTSSSVPMTPRVVGTGKREI